MKYRSILHDATWNPIRKERQQWITRADGRAHRAMFGVGPWYWKCKCGAAIAGFSTRKQAKDSYHRHVTRDH